MFGQSMSNCVSIRNRMTGKMVPIALEVLDKYLKAIKARNKFLHFNNTFDHQNLDDVDIYISLLDSWDLAVQNFSPYANIYCCAVFGYSLN